MTEKLIYRPAQNKKTEINQILFLLEPEFISRGGNLRDLNLTGIQNILRDGEFWLAFNQRREIIAGLSLTLFTNSDPQPWSYLNHAVVRPDYRHQGVMTELIKHLLLSKRPSASYFAISVSKTIFQANGFRLLSLEQLINLNKSLAEVVFYKLRPGTAPYIFVKSEKFANPA